MLHNTFQDQVSVVITLKTLFRNTFENAENLRCEGHGIFAISAIIFPKRIGRLKGRSLQFVHIILTFCYILDLFIIVPRNLQPFRIKYRFVNHKCNKHFKCEFNCISRVSYGQFIFWYIGYRLFHHCTMFFHMVML